MSSQPNRKGIAVKEIKILRPDDGHCHLRGDDRLLKVIKFTAEHFARAVVEPNIGKEGLTKPDQVVAYRKKVNQAAREVGCPAFKPVMTFKVTQDTTPELVQEMYDVGGRVAKSYPDNPELTTNSAGGVSDFKALLPTWLKMAELGMVHQIHGEDAKPETFCLDREKVFLPTLDWLVETVPGLKIVLEHVTTKDAVEMVTAMPDNVAASITPQHMSMTLNDLLDRGLRPHLYCKPLLKFPPDLAAIVAAVLSGNPKFFLGTDSAPHNKKDKESDCGCAGVFSAPVILQFLATWFERYNALDKMEPFVSHFMADHYGLERNTGHITLVREPWEVPLEYDGIVPFMTGQTLDWQIA